MARRTSRGKAAVVIGAGALVALGGAGVAAATASDDAERPLTGNARQQAEDAALAETGGGRVSETEAGDEDSMYEVEVTLDDGSQVDVQLDEGFTVVATEAESSGEGGDG